MLILQDTASMNLMKYIKEEYAGVGEKAETVNQAFRNNAAYNNINIEPELAKITTPTVVIQGDQDYVVGLGHAELIYDALSGLSSENKGDGLLKRKAIVDNVFNSEKLTKEQSTELVEKNQDKLILNPELKKRFSGKRYLVKFYCNISCKEFFIS